MVSNVLASKEMFERWCRSVGVDLFDLLLASIRHPWYSLLSKYGATLLYCSLHEQELALLQNTGMRGVLLVHRPGSRNGHCKRVTVQAGALEHCRI